MCRRETKWVRFNRGLKLEITSTDNRVSDLLENLLVILNRNLCYDNILKYIAIYGDNIRYGPQYVASLIK